MKKINLLLVVLLFVHLFVLFQLQFTVWPEMVSFPYLINHSFILYKDAVHAYPPLLVTLLAVLFKIFGYKLLVIKIFTWSLFILNDILIFLIIEKLTSRVNFSLLAVFLYIALQPILQGNMVWPDLVLITPILVAVYFLFQKKVFWSGLFFAISILVKQTGVFYLATGAIYLLNSDMKRLKNFVAGLLVVMTPFVLWLLVNNNFKDFLNWAIIYPSTFWTKFPGYVQMQLSKTDIFILLALLLPVVLLFRKLKEKYLVLFLIAGIIGVYPRFSFFHFQSALSFLVIIYGVLLTNLKNKKFVYLFLLIPLVVLFLMRNDIILGGNRFWDEDQKLARIIEEKVSPGKPVYLLGLNSDIYQMTGTLPTKPWLDNFGWYLEIPGVQEKVIEGFEKNLPSTIFWQTPIDGNWFDIGVYQPKEITNWIKANYNMRVEVIDGIREWVKK